MLGFVGMSFGVGRVFCPFHSGRTLSSLIWSCWRGATSRRAGKRLGRRISVCPSVANTTVCRGCRCRRCPCPSLAVSRMGARHRGVERRQSPGVELCEDSVRCAGVPGLKFCHCGAARGVQAEASPSDARALPVPLGSRLRSWGNVSAVGSWVGPARGCPFKSNFLRVKKKGQQCFWADGSLCQKNPKTSPPPLPQGSGANAGLPRRIGLALQCDSDTLRCVAFSQRTVFLSQVKQSSGAYILGRA